MTEGDRAGERGSERARSAQDVHPGAQEERRAEVQQRAKGDLTGALSDFDQALTLDPAAVHNDRTVADAFSRRGYMRAHRLEVEAAIEDFNKALVCYQGNPDYYFRRGNALLVKGDLPGAITDFNNGLTLKPDNSQASFAYASRGYAPGGW